MITPLRKGSGKTTTLLTVADTTITKYDILVYASGYVQRATNTVIEGRFMALEDKVTAAGDHENLLVLYLGGVECEADTTDNMAQSYLGTYVDLTDHDTIDPDSGSYDCFYITEMIGATTDKKCRGYFVQQVSV